ncbi:hypothetical protein ACFY1B_49345 [Streptomyces mirabilis]|uniref:hypothetical protein n=1 Tax=Streptomyces mirabilis TaxID=68239 RepID=UPI0036C698E6
MRDVIASDVTSLAASSDVTRDVGWRQTLSPTPRRAAARVLAAGQDRTSPDPLYAKPFMGIQFLIVHSFRKAGAGCLQDSAVIESPGVDTADLRSSDFWPRTGISWLCVNEKTLSRSFSDVKGS